MKWAQILVTYVNNQEVIDEYNSKNGQEQVEFIEYLASMKLRYKLLWKLRIDLCDIEPSKLTNLIHNYTVEIENRAQLFNKKRYN